MDAIRRRFSLYLLAFLAFLCLPLTASAELVEGRDWKAVSAPATEQEGDEIEVLEFFSYGCPHCGDINPLIKQWAEGLPSDVRFERVPVTFGRAAWESLSRLYFALDFAGELETLDQMVFDAVIKQRTNLYTEKTALNWIGEQGVDREAFAKFYNSFAVEAALARANTLAARFRVDAVPMIIVDGRYVVLGEGAKSKADLIEIADTLIVKAREARQD
ncbi:MAG: thiol:disulfide interchange protein DsbA/DsbL [Chromatiaceae bacterium]|nr:thiol:disulfide interchange protein DsbA/DsbL [Chromatiaceae bacterium]MCF7993598.1 thiol:disulfide interchange protein DsbA/DsbL [Chromatiaceae bacterium]MCF8003142.1 thiol:disulfide interchange protein DsbA/DsbL [Chromatiaceae bacterium]MCF8017707.1 thiol:disulfide interchange protein DsbA/DsbL [Chromatiaceae bacterium]